MDRQYNDQKKGGKGQTIQWPKERGKRTDNHLQSTTQIIKNLSTRTPLKNRRELRKDKQFPLH